jgi:molecular chaperone DnaJ
LDGVDRLTIPPGTQHGATFRLRNLGVPVLRSNKRGDQVVSVRVVVPEKLTQRQRELLEEFATTAGGSAPVKDKRNWFDKLLDSVGRVFGG